MATETEPARTYPSELPVLALRETVVFPLTLQPLAINRPMSIEAVNRALAGDRLIFLSLQTNDKDEPEPGRPADRSAPLPAIRQMAKVPNGGIHVIVEGLTRARRPTRSTKRGQALRATVAPLPETFRATARSGCVRAAPPGADRSRAVAVERAVAGTARPGRRHRRSAAAGLSAVQPARHQGRGEAADPRRRRPDRQAAGGVRRAQPRNRAARDEEARSSRRRSRK